jgi:hypothetical protein
MRRPALHVVLIELEHGSKRTRAQASPGKKSGFVVVRVLACLAFASLVVRRLAFCPQLLLVSFSGHGQ